MITFNKKIVLFNLHTKKILEYLSLNGLYNALKSNPDLACLHEAELGKAMQTLYATSGCDYTSFFYGYGKSTFFSLFSQNANFIVGKEVDFQNLSLDSTPNESLAAFYRLIRTIHYKHKKTFSKNVNRCRDGSTKNH